MRASRDAGALGRQRRADAVERWGLGLLAALTAAAVAGFAVYGRDPSRLAGLPSWALSFYGASFGFFAQAHVWLAAGLLAVVLTLRAGLRWVAVFGALYAISLASELAGTTWGIPFGAYAYSELLGPMWLGRVPVVIPLSWFFMAVASYALAAVAVARGGARVGLASLVLLAWDLALDPAMSYATKYWVWGEDGPYYGMPWLNLFGWYVTGLVLMSVLRSLRAEEWLARIAPRWWAAFYAVNLTLALGMCAAAGLWGAVAVTVLVLALIVAGLRVAVRLPAVRLA